MRTKNNAFFDIPFWTLWEDMQVLLCQFLEGDDIEWDEYLVDESLIRVYTTEVGPYLAQIQADIRRGALPWDDRGPEHVTAFQDTMRMNDFIPPIIYRKGRWMDGRHRLLAAGNLNMRTIPGMDYNEWKKSLVKKPQSDDVPAY